MPQNRDTRLNLFAGLRSVGVALILGPLKLRALYRTDSLAVAANLAGSAMGLMMSLNSLGATRCDTANPYNI